MHTRIIVTHYGWPDAHQVVEEACPEPKNGEVRVRVLAAGVALPDLMMREGFHPETPRVPFTPGGDLVGIVDRLGDGVSGIEPGQRVAALPISGAYARTSCSGKEASPERSCWSTTSNREVRMVSDVQTMERLLTAENWELARQAINEAVQFAEEKQKLEEEFEISLGDLGSIIDLPEDSLKRLQKRLLKTVDAYFTSARDELHKKVCGEFDYCKMKKKWGWRVCEYLIGAVDVFATNGGATLAMLGLKTEVLDKLCRCKS